MIMGPITGSPALAMSASLNTVPAAVPVSSDDVVLDASRPCPKPDGHYRMGHPPHRLQAMAEGVSPASDEMNFITTYSKFSGCIGV